ncbi:MAG TPA: FAD-binding oxidoreductase [Solirubrobacteraceae bacterium]
MTRVGIAGSGIAGTLLAWRLASLRPDWSIELIGPRASARDATAVSGGLVRGFEVDPESCRQASESLLEMRDDPRLRAWSGYTEAGSVYVCDAMTRAAVNGLLQTVEQRLAGSARLLTGAELCDRHGWRGVPSGSLAVAERHAGYYSPDRLRAHVQARLERLDVTLLDGQVTAIEAGAGGGASCEVGGRRHGFDVFVVAAGSWTPQVLARNGLSGGDLRTKAVEYGVYAARGWRPPAFVDDTSGLYGRPLAGGRMILGIPSERWGVDPDDLAAAPAAAASAAGLAAARFPRLSLGRALALRTASDCYAQPARLALRTVDGADGLFTFTGGSGGSAKTALCASREAAAALVAGPGVAAQAPIYPRSDAREPRHERLHADARPAPQPA